MQRWHQKNVGLLLHPDILMQYSQCSLFHFLLRVYTTSSDWTTALPPPPLSVRIPSTTNLTPLSNRNIPPWSMCNELAGLRHTPYPRDCLQRQRRRYKCDTDRKNLCDKHTRGWIQSFSQALLSSNTKHTHAHTHICTNDRIRNWSESNLITLLFSY